MSKGSFTKEELQNKIKLLEEENIKMRQTIADEMLLRDLDTRAHYNDGLAEGRKEGLDLVKSILQTIAWFGISGHQEPEEEK